MCDLFQEDLLSVEMDDGSSDREYDNDGGGGVLARDADGPLEIRETAAYDHALNVALIEELEALMPEGIPELDDELDPEPVLPTEDKIRACDPKDSPGPFPIEGKTTDPGTGGPTPGPGGDDFEGPGGDEDGPRGGPTLAPVSEAPAARPGPLRQSASGPQAARAPPGHVYEDGELIDGETVRVRTDVKGNAVFTVDVLAGQTVVTTKLWVNLSSKWLSVGTKASISVPLKPKQLPLELESRVWFIPAGSNVVRVATFPESVTSRALSVMDIFTNAKDVFKTQLARKNSSMGHLPIWFPAQAGKKVSHF
ncbi:hypothetical protein B0J13DRAFT_532109 [Dactylonectria estremocensis]|uniref:Uncharacterized protein n=1 Tax=Dactylonectria estremocensis TaxID=1079267 RepID=A0A9P9DJ48_9HYPO|nr:hypothetical protein B0J13DRAFT_532109 [Dactylonectria estremocensis]